MFNVVLVEPQIPQNTGNIARTCGASGCKLHLVKPFAFEITGAKIRRAGLDYWDKVDITIYESLDEFFKKNSGGEFFFCSTKAKKFYSEVKFPKNAFLLFGKETKGLDEQLIFDNFDRAIKIPMGKEIRSLNLANSVAIILYEALRQYSFLDLE